MKKIRITKKLLSISKKYTKLYTNAEDDFNEKILILEKEMQKETGVKDIEFFCSDGALVGIGTPSCPKKMKLIHSEEL